MKRLDDLDPNSPQRIQREWRFLRNTKVRTQSVKQLKEARKYFYDFFIAIVFWYTVSEIFLHTTLPRFCGLLLLWIPLLKKGRARKRVYNSFDVIQANVIDLRCLSSIFPAPVRLDDELFINKNVQPPCAIKFHPYEPHLAVADKTGVSIWNYEAGAKLSHFNNGNPKTSRITSLDILNEHDLSLLLTASGRNLVILSVIRFTLTLF